MLSRSGPIFVMVESLFIFSWNVNMKSIGKHLNLDKRIKKLPLMPNNYQITLIKVSNDI